MSSPAQQENNTQKLEENSGDRNSETSDTIENSGKITENSTSCLKVEDIPPIDGSGDNSPHHSPSKTTPNLSTPNENDQSCVSSKDPVETTTDTSLFGNKDVSASLDPNASLIEDMASKIDSIVKETEPKQVVDAIVSAEASGTSTPGEPDDDEMVLKWEDDDDEVDDLMEKDLSNITKPQPEENKESDDDHSNLKNQSLEVEMTTETQTMENIDVVIDSENGGKSLEKSVDENSTSKQLSSSVELIEQIEDDHILRSNDSETEKPSNTNALDVQKTESSELEEEISNLKVSLENSNETIEHPETNIVGTVSKDVNIESKLSANKQTKISNEHASHRRNSTEVEVSTDNTFSTDISTDLVCESNNANDSEMEVDSSNANLNLVNDSEMEIDTSVEKSVDQQSNDPAESSVINLDEPTKNVQDIDVSQISQDQNKNADVSAMDISIEALDHGLVKPDMMIEIPTQELIDCTDTEKTDSDLTNSKDDADKDSSTDTNITALVDKIDKIIHESEEQPNSTSQKAQDGDMETGNIDTPEKEITPVTETVQLEIVTKNIESPEVSSNLVAVSINLPDITDKVTANIEAGSIIKGIDDIKEIAVEDKSPSKSKCETEQTELQRDSENNEASSTISVTENLKDSSTDTNITALVEKIDKIIHESEEQPNTTSQKAQDCDMETGNIDTPEKEVTPVTDTVQLEIVTKNIESPEVSSNLEAVSINLPDITDKVTANIEAGSIIKGIDDIKEIADEDKSPSKSQCETEQTELQRDSENNEASTTISVTENLSKLNIPIKDNNVEPITPTVTPEIANPENDSAKIDDDVSQKITQDIAENIVTKVEDNVEASQTEKPSIAETSDTEKTATEETALESQSKSPEIPPKESDDLKPSSMEVQESKKVSKEAETPSSYMAPDTSDEVPEMTDSLGLLAESSRVMEDDEEQESEREDADDDDDFDPDDESSNQMTGDQSEDSNAQQSESDVPKDAQVEGSGDKDVEIKNEFSFAISNVVSGDIEKDMDVDEACDEDESAVDIADEDSTLMEVAQASPADAPMEESLDIEDNMPEAVDKLISEFKTDLNEEPSDKDSSIQEDEKKKDAILKDLLAKTSSVPSITPPPATNQTMSPPKVKKLEISKPKHVMNFVDLEESSSEDDVQEISKKEATSPTPDDVTTVNLPADIEIMSSGENTSEITTKETEITIRGVPKPPPLKPARLNTDEVTIKTATNTESTLVFPEDKIDQSQGEKTKPKFSLEVFSLDSDDEESVPAPETALSSLPPSPQVEPEKSQHRCINLTCKSDHTVSYSVADSSTLAFYDAKKKRAMVCERCAEVVVQRAYMLVEGMKSFTPLLGMEIKDSCQDLVEISDSDSEDEVDPDQESSEKIGSGGVAFLEKHLASVLNDTWIKYKMEERLEEAEIELSADLDRLQHESEEINEMLKECQAATDKLRDELYATFDHERQELPAIAIMDTPTHAYACTELAQPVHEVRPQKRRFSAATETPTKKFAIPLGYSPLDSDKAQKEVPKPVVPAVDTCKVDDDKDVSVVTLSAEAAPADLPPPGELTRPHLKIGAQVFAMRNAFSSWVKAKVIDLLSKGALTTSQFSMYRVKFEAKTAKSPYKILPGRCLAYNEPANVRMTIGTRVIALFKDERLAGREPFYSGVVAEIPNPVNNYRYLVFFDDGYAQYVSHADTRLVSECSQVVWDEVHPFSREFVRQYLLAYPERPMVRLHTGQRLKIELNGKWWLCRVIQVDASLVQVNFEEDKRTEWIYRGSTRLAPLYLELQAAERTRARPLPRNRAQKQSNMPYVEYTRSDEQEANKAAARAQANVEELRRQRAVAKKSTSSQPTAAAPAHATDTVSSRVVYYTPKNAVKPHKMVAHSCGPHCRRTDVLALSELRTYNPLAKPLLSGWERQIVRYKGSREVMYRAPCGRRVRSLPELHRYLRLTGCDMPVDLFDFAPHTHCLAEFVLNKCIVAKKDLSHGKENVPVPCVNYYDESLPEFCSYNTERTPTAGVPLNLDPEFLCGCDCTDDCEDKTKCACWKMTLEGARTIGIRGSNVGYVYKRLPEPLPSGIYECNSRCKCKHTCLNRVAQHPLQLKLQVFKTLNRGWGIRALNDVPKGAFLCVYAGNLLTDATANLDGLNEGDEYLAELDYIEVVEQMKEGYEEDIPKDSVLGKDGAKKEESETEEESSTSEEEERPSKNEREDGDFEPGFIPARTQFSKRLRRRDKVKKEKEDNENGVKKEIEDDCITISDDEEIREPSRFTAQAGMGANQFVSKYRSVRSHFGKDEACYIMDAKVQGNIGRYLNHSCSPNVFVQNVFVDTHDPRFPWVAFFALSHIRAGTELTWNYNYDVGSVPGKALYCYCGAQNCRGRLL